MITVGMYRHYKGKLYQVLGMVTHSETKEPLVLYRSVQEGTLWARPEKMWNELVKDAQGNEVLRFSRAL